MTTRGKKPRVSSKTLPKAKAKKSKAKVRPVRPVGIGAAIGAAWAAVRARIAKGAEAAVKITLSEAVTPFQSALYQNLGALCA